MEATFVSAMLREFRQRGDKTISAMEFQAELKELTRDDKLWYADALEAHGYKITNRASL